MIIACGGIKGGSGKTTVAVNLAVMRSKAGKQVLVVDADSADNRNASDFASHRDSVVEGGKGFEAVQINGKDVATNVPGLARRFDDVVVDVGGADSHSQRAALVIADVLVLPVFPSSLDIWVLGKVQSVIEEARIQNPRLRVVSFLMRADASGTTNDEAAEILRSLPGIEYHDVPVVNRKVFRTAAALGLGAVEVKPKDAKAWEEICALYAKVFGEGYPL